MAKSSVTLYGIPNCDTVKKARKWLETNGVEFTFHDFRKDGLAKTEVKRWLDALGWEVVLNRKGTTWRNLPEATRNAVVDAKTVLPLLVEQPTLIKRPVLVRGDSIQCGFSADNYAALLQ